MVKEGVLIIIYALVILLTWNEDDSYAFLIMKDMRILFLRFGLALGRLHLQLK